MTRDWFDEIDKAIGMLQQYRDTLTDKLGRSRCNCCGIMKNDDLPASKADIALETAISRLEAVLDYIEARA